MPVPPGPLDATDQAAEHRAELARLVADADRLRDGGAHDAAADAYARVLDVLPWRTDLRVQYGNMLKDSGRLPDAELAYRTALLDSPEDADIHLQLGHVLKLMGRRPAALDCYRTALRLDPGLAGARLELVQAGSAIHQGEAIEAQVRGHGIEQMLSIAGALSDMRRQLDRIERIVPDLATWTAIPADRYGLYRRLFDVPDPGPCPSDAAPPVRIVLSADETTIERLHAQIAGFQAMTDRSWTLTATGRGADARSAVERLATADPRLRWQQGLPDESPGAQERRAGDGATGWLLLPAADAIPHPRLLVWMRAAIDASTATVLFFDEEECVPDGTGIDRPERLIARWSFDPDALLQANIFGDSLAIRADAWRNWTCAIDPDLALAGRRSALLLAAAGATAAVGHIPYPLMSVPVPTQPARHARLASHEAAVRRAHRESGLVVTMPDTDGPARLRVDWPAPDVAEAITVVIGTRDHPARCRHMVESLHRTAAAPESLTCLVVDNGAGAPDGRGPLDALEASGLARVVRMQQPFNWSQINNQAAGLARTPLLVFANDDMEMLSDGWDTVLRSLLRRPEVGAVGAKLLYPDRTLQHGGILFGWRGSVIHDGLHEAEDSAAQSMRWRLTRRVGAVTGAFLAIRRAVMEQHGGFDAVHLPIGYSDVDLCLRLRAGGLHVLWAADIVLLHDESLSRGLDHLDPERHARDRTERGVMTRRWGAAVMGQDRSVHPAWHDATLPFRLLRPVSVARALSHLRAGCDHTGLPKHGG